MRLELFENGTQIDPGSLDGEVDPHLIQRMPEGACIAKAGGLTEQGIVGVHALCQRQGVDGLLPRL